MPVLLETTGSFQLIDELGQLVPAHRPAVVEFSNLLQSRAVKGEILVVSNRLKTEATDAEFAKFWSESEGDRELAISSFLSAYGANEEAEVVESAPKTTKKR